MFRGVVAALAMVMAGGMFSGAQACEGLSQGPREKVVQVIDGSSFLLEGGAKVRLSGVQAPKLAQGRVDFDDWPFAAQARAALEELVLGQEISVRYGAVPKDRFGRLLGHGFLVGENSQEIWLQEWLVAGGFARVYSLPDNVECVGELLRVEARARREKKGLWQSSFYHIEMASDVSALARRSGDFVLVEGVVRDVGQSSGRYYLNFGADWDTDFTVQIDAKDAKRFEARDFDLTSLSGALIRVRGWVENFRGPRIMGTHPEQIEVLALKAVN